MPVEVLSLDDESESSFMHAAECHQGLELTLRRGGRVGNNCRRACLRVIVNLCYTVDYRDFGV